MDDSLLEWAKQRLGISDSQYDNLVKRKQEESPSTAMQHMSNDMHSTAIELTMMNTVMIDHLSQQLFQLMAEMQLNNQSNEGKK